MAVVINPARRRRIFAVLDQTSRSLEHLHQPALHKMLPVLRQAHHELEDNLREWLARENGDALFTTQRYRNALVAVRHAWSTVRRLVPAVESALWDGADKAWRTSTNNLTVQLENFEQIFEGTIQPISLDAAAVLAAGEELLWKRFASSAERYAGNVQDRLVQELAVSRVKSETIFELTNRLQRRMPELFASDRWAAERLARTETLNAYNVFHVEGIREAAEDDSELVARWDASYDWRRCPLCASLDGQICDVIAGESFTARWSAGKRQHTITCAHPPAHPCCRCSVTPWHREWGELARSQAPVPNPVARAERAIAARP